MNPIVAILFGAILGGFIVWGVMEFIWRGKLIEATKGAEDAEEKIALAQSAQQSAQAASASTSQERDTYRKQVEELLAENTKLKQDAEKEELKRFSIIAERNRAEFDFQSAQNQKANLENQLSRLQIEKAELASEVERLRFLLGPEANEEEEEEE